MALLLQSTASLVMAQCTCASLIFTSLNDAPSVVCMEPKYLNESISPSTFLFTQIFADGLNEDFAFVGEPISIPYSAAVFSSFFR